MLPNSEKIADWLLSSLELKSTLFHVGSYCHKWRASTAGHQSASFHLVLQGECWLHLPAYAARPAYSLHLQAGDALFLLDDIPHCLSPNSRPPAPGDDALRFGEMQAFNAMEPGTAVPGQVGLACGFFEFRSELDRLVFGLLPEYLVVPLEDPALAGARVVFDLIRNEAGRGGEPPSALIARLTDVLFFYALRDAVRRQDIAPGLWSLMRRTEFAPLVAAIIDAPGKTWTTDVMAAFVHMSRARFCKQFSDACGQPPAQFVTLIRMQVAAAMLREGAPILGTAEHVGYQSESAFSHAFKRITGMQPGAYRRAGTTHEKWDVAGALH